MEISKKYVVYELNKVMNSESHLALEEVKFTGWVINSFDSEEDAIKLLVEKKLKYVDYVILPTVYISE